MAHKATYSMKDIGTFNTFKDAFKAIYDRVLEDLNQNGQIPLVILNEATWIISDGTMVPFCIARDRMCNEGYLVGGKWKDKT